MNAAKTATTTMYFGFGRCLIGTILVARSKQGLCAVLPGDTPAALRRDLRRRFPVATLVEDEAAVRDLVAEIACFIDVPTTPLTKPLDLLGSAFEQQVWQVLRNIPVGQTASYCDVARRIGQPDQVREVVRAIRANALAVVVPCHRVMKNRGSLSGYQWGGYRKRALLQREAADLLVRPGCRSDFACAIHP